MLYVTLHLTTHHVNIESMSTTATTTTRRQYRGVSAEQRRAERRLKLLDAGKQVFGTEGYQAATVRQICTTAGLTERYFYESFKNLNELFNEVYDRELDALRAALLAEIAAAPNSIEGMARAALQRYFSTLQDDPCGARILIIEVYGTTHDMERMYRRGVSDFAEIIRSIIETQISAEDSYLDAGLLSTAVVGAHIHVAMRWLLGGYKEAKDDVVENCLTIITSVSERIAKDS